MDPPGGRFDLFPVVSSLDFGGRPRTGVGWALEVVGVSFKS